MYIYVFDNWYKLLNIVETNFQKFFILYFFQCMSMIEDMTKEVQALSDEHQESMIEDMTKEMQALRDEHKEQMDQIKGVSTNVPTDNNLRYTNKYLMDNHTC